MKTIAAETSLETNILPLPQLLLKFSSNILQIEYQMLVLAHTDLRKYEDKMGISRHIFTNGRYSQPIYFSSANVINSINQ